MKKPLKPNQVSKQGETPAPCPVCKKLVFPKALGVHMKVHRNSKPSTTDLPRTADLADEVVLVPVKLSFIRMLISEALKGVK